jgi:MFS family permease
MAYSTVPSPLYVLYQQRDGFNQFMITVIFAAYAVGVMLSLFLAGHLSDLFGRRKVLLVALCINALTGVLFLFGSGLAMLLAARLISGIAVGMVTGTATAYLAELHGVARPNRKRTRSDLVASTAPMIGLGGGALVAGLVAQYGVMPLQLPYGVFILLLVIAILVVRAVPETVGRVGRPSYRIRRIRLPQQARARFFAAAGVALASFAMLALFSSVAPAFMAGTLHLHSRALAGAVTFLVYGAGALTPLLMRFATLDELLIRGFRLMLVGLVVLAVGVGLANFAVFLGGGVLVGAAAGTLFKGCITTVVSIAPPETRAETLAGLFLMAYIGLSLPVVSLGVAYLYIPGTTAILGFVLVFLLIMLASRRWLLAPARAAS